MLIFTRKQTDFVFARRKIKFFTMHQIISKKFFSIETYNRKQKTVVEQWQHFPFILCWRFLGLWSLLKNFQELGTNWLFSSKENLIDFSIAYFVWRKKKRSLQTYSSIFCIASPARRSRWHILQITGKANHIFCSLSSCASVWLIVLFHSKFTAFSSLCHYNNTKYKTEHKHIHANTRMCIFSRHHTKNEWQKRLFLGFVLTFSHFNFITNRM